MRKSFRQRLGESTPLLGTLISTASQACTEVLAGSGYDWLFVDAEHGAIALSDLGSIIRAAGGNAHILARLPNHDPASFKQALDAGADGVIVPFVNTVTEARHAVMQAKYPPLGGRSVGVGRAQGFGFDFDSYVSSANDTTALIVQIEHIQAVENVEQILDVSGIDGVFVGPYDLSSSMGLIGKVADPRVIAAVNKVRQACRARGIPLGIFAMQIETALDELQLGCRFIVVGTDMFLLGAAARRAVALLRGDSK